MTVAISRERQIELMMTAKERHEAIVNRWLKDPIIRKFLSKEGQPDERAGLVSKTMRT